MSSTALVLESLFPVEAYLSGTASASAEQVTQWVQIPVSGSTLTSPQFPVGRDSSVKPWLAGVVPEGLSCARGQLDPPRTPLARTLLRLRERYILAGGKLLSWEEIEEEVRARRGEL